METVGLADAVEALRDELTAARNLGKGQDLLFEVGPVDVEFSVVVKRTGDGKAGLTIGVVTVGVAGSKWTAMAYVNNITNERTLLDPQPQIDLQMDAFVRYLVNRPITAGLDLTYKY